MTETYNSTLQEEFVKYLVEKNIINNNGLKTLTTLITEYPTEWENYKDENFTDYEDNSCERMSKGLSAFECN